MVVYFLSIYGNDVIEQKNKCSQKRQKWEDNKFLLWTEKMLSSFLLFPNLRAFLSVNRFLSRDSPQNKKTQ